MGERKMNEQPPPGVEPIPGEAIHESKTRHLYVGILGIVIFGFSVAFLILFWLGAPRPYKWLGVGGLLGSGLFLQHISNLLSGRRLLIGEDCLQYLKGATTVVGQVPYDNIAEIRLIRFGSGNRIGIKLHD